jgi:hypothetical protein
MYTPSSVYGEDVWERVEPWTPQDLSPFTGDYLSEEAETTLTVALESGKLVIHRHPDSTFSLTPTYADAFNSDLGSIRFLRDASGKIVTLSLGQARVWDLRFTRTDSGIKAVASDHSRPRVSIQFEPSNCERHRFSCIASDAVGNLLLRYAALKGLMGESS